MGAFFGAIVSWVLEHFFGLKKASDPTPIELAASNATAQTELVQQEAANAVITSAAVARADASDRVVRTIADTPAAADPGTDRPPSAVKLALKKQFPDDFRD